MSCPDCKCGRCVYDRIMGYVDEDKAKREEYASEARSLRERLKDALRERDEARVCEAEAMRARKGMARMVAVYRLRLEKLTACHCDEAWTSRNLHAPECQAEEGWMDEPTADELLDRVQP